MDNEDSCTEMMSVTKVSQTIVPRDKGIVDTGTSAQECVDLRYVPK